MILCILCILGLLGLLLMLLLCMLRPARREQSPLKKKRSGLNLVALLNRYYKIEPLIYRHHRIVGFMVISGELLMFAFLRKLPMLDFFSSAYPNLLWVQLVILVGWMIAILVLVIGITLVIRPSALKRIEAWSNRWIEPF